MSGLAATSLVANALVAFPFCSMKDFYMKNLILFSVSLAFLGCAGTSIGPVTNTGKPNEYVVQVVDDHSLASSLDLAKQAAMEKAKETCAKSGQVHEIIYQLDRAFTLVKRPETTLYFRCVDKLSAS